MNYEIERDEAACTYLETAVVYELYGDDLTLNISAVFNAGADWCKARMEKEIAKADKLVEALNFIADFEVENMTESRVGATAARKALTVYREAIQKIEGEV